MHTALLMLDWYVGVYGLRGHIFWAKMWTVCADSRRHEQVKKKDTVSKSLGFSF